MALQHEQEGSLVHRRSAHEQDEVATNQLSAGGKGGSPLDEKIAIGRPIEPRETKSGKWYVKDCLDIVTVRTNAQRQQDMGANGQRPAVRMIQSKNLKSTARVSDMAETLDLGERAVTLFLRCWMAYGRTLVV